MSLAPWLFTGLFLAGTIALALVVPRGELDLEPWTPAIAAAPGGEVGFGLHVRGGDDAPTAYLEEAPAGWDVTVRTVDRGGTGIVLVSVDVPRGAAPGAHTIRLAAEQGLATAKATVRVNVAPLEGPTTAAGRGLLLQASGAWDNGTLFWTNDPAVQASVVPRSGSAEARPFPLKVWLGSGPGAVPEPYASQGYLRVIPGLEAQLVGMHTGESRMVRVPATLAYTRPERAGHFLYGEDISFLVTVPEVVVFEERGLLDSIPPGWAG